MKIKYKFANGEVKYVEVNDEVGAEIIKSRKIEENGDRKERYHCYSIAGLDYEGEEFADKHTPESLLLNKEDNGWIAEFLKTLTDVQRERLEMRLDGMSMNEIARVQGTTFRAVKKTFLQISEKISNFFQKKGTILPLEISV